MQQHVHSKKLKPERGSENYKPQTTNSLQLMNKIFLVARREFLTRVQKKTFLLTTILLPLIIFLFYALIIYFSVAYVVMQGTL